MNGDPSDVPSVVELERISPVRMLWMIVGGVAGAEALFELVLYWRPTMSPYVEAVLDATFIVAVALPLVYVSVYRPMRLLIDQYRSALSEVRTLRGIITICSACKKIRTGTQSWEKIEAYVHAHTEAEFSHGLCPDCIRKHYPADADWLIEEMSAHTSQDQAVGGPGSEAVTRGNS